MVFAPLLAGIFDGSDGKWSSSAGGDPDDDIVPARLSFFHFTLPEFAGIFVRLDRGGQGRGTAGHDELDGSGIDVERRWTLRRVERGDAAAGSCTDVDQSAASLQRVRNQVDGRAICGKGTLHRGRDLASSELMTRDDFQSRLQVQIAEARFGCSVVSRLEFSRVLLGSPLHSAFSSASTTAS